MTWPITMAAMLLWVCAWLCIAAKYTASRDGDGLVRAFGQLLPPFVVITFLAAFAAFPARRSAFAVMVLWLHHASFWGLFLFLLAGQYFQVEAWWKIRGDMPAQAVSASYRRLWILTEIVPAPVALTIFLTGLRLIWQRAGDEASIGEGYSLSAFWLQALIVGFSLFFWDGILGFTPIVRNMRRRWDADAFPSQQRPGVQPVGETVQLLIHLLSWPVVFLVGVFRWDFPTFLTGSIEGLERHLSRLPPGWPEVTTALMLWLLTGALVASVRFCFKSVTRSARSETP
jgi:hypothetical protein